MHKKMRSLINVCLSLLTFVVVVGLSHIPAISQDTLPSASSGTVGYESLVAGDMANQAMKRYSVNLSKSNVVPTAPDTTAMGIAQATLMGDRLMVQGSFSQLSSGLRDYATDPVNPPNPKITSAVHIHRGAATENGPFQFALTVMMNDMGMGGKFSGEYTLSKEQLQALADGKLYIDLHTTQNRAGELRGYLRPA